jgi:hypothetical protein
VFVNISEFRNWYEEAISFVERESYGMGQAPGAYHCHEAVLVARVACFIRLHNTTHITFLNVKSSTPIDPSVLPPRHWTVYQGNVSSHVYIKLKNVFSYIFPRDQPRQYVDKAESAYGSRWIVATDDLGAYIRPLATGRHVLRCKIWGFHGGDYDDYHLLGDDNHVLRY